MTIEELDDKIDDWHDSDTDLSLAEYLGWTQEEYIHWFETLNMPIKGKGYSNEKEI